MSKEVFIVTVTNNGVSYTLGFKSKVEAYQHARKATLNRDYDSMVSHACMFSLEGNTLTVVYEWIPGMEWLYDEELEKHDKECGLDKYLKGDLRR